MGGGGGGVATRDTAPYIYIIDCMLHKYPKLNSIFMYYKQYMLYTIDYIYIYHT